MKCRELAKKKSDGPLWVEREIYWLWEILTKPKPSSARVILEPKKGQKTPEIIHIQKQISKACDHYQWTDSKFLNLFHSLFVSKD